MIICFELTMPNVGSWNGKWTGADNKYYVCRNLPLKQGQDVMRGAKSRPVFEGMFTRVQVGETKPSKSWYFGWDDGWGANVEATVVTAAERRKLEKKSAGFRGYEWMIDSIIDIDKILTSDKRAAYKQEINGTPIITV